MTWMSRLASDAGGGTDAFEAPAHDVQGVLGGIEQDAPGSAHGEAAQARDAGGDGDRKVEGEEGLAAFGFAADDADGLVRTTARRPASAAARALGEAPGGLDRKLAHRRRRIAALVSALRARHRSRRTASRRSAGPHVVRRPRAARRP